MTEGRSLRAAKPVLGLDQPRVFECTIRRALELRRSHREVFLLKDIQGHTLQEIAAILGISTETARLRLMHARREIGHLGDSDVTERAR